MRITVYKRNNNRYIAFKDSNPFEWATGFSKENAVHNLINKYRELESEKTYNFNTNKERNI